MNDLDLLIQTANNLCNTLTVMADNEIKYGYELCHLMEQISYDFYKSANELKEIRTYIHGEIYES